MTFRVAHWDMLDDNLAFWYAREGYFVYTNGKCLVFAVKYAKRKIILEHTNGKCHLCTFHSTCRPFCNIDMHFIKLSNILMPRY